MAVTFKERVDDTNPPSVAGFGPNGGKGSATWYLDSESGAITNAKLREAILQLVGDTQYAKYDGRIHRTLPMFHPQWPWMFVAGLPTMQGCGLYNKIPQEFPLVTDTPGFGDYALYEQYNFKIDFEPKINYLTDQYINVVPNASWFSDNDNGVNPPDSFLYADEYRRFTDFEITPLNNNVTAQKGAMKFYTADGKDPNFFPIPDLMKMILPDMLIKFRWLQVPYRYVTSIKSYLNKYRGRVNQVQFQNWPAGSLLYTSYNARSYIPPVPTIVADGGSSTIEKLCDLELVFMQTDRTCTQPPAGPPVKLNRNYIINGWNSQPWLQTRKFYYAASSSPDFRPPWLSVPFSILFTDPDIAQPGTI